MDDAADTGETVELVRRSLAPETREPFRERVEEQAADLIERIRRGGLDNADPTVGLELECYAVDDEGRLATLPDEAFADAPMSRELGLHNFEINTPPAVLDEAGIEAQAEAIRERFEAAREATEAVGLTPVLDAMWTVPPAEGTREYLGAIREDGEVVLAENMTASPRYHALDNHVLEHAGGEIAVDVPGATVSVPTILIESLTSSIQPHLQVPTAEAFPAHYDAAIRTLGPVLALATNSPFLPADCYRDADPEVVLAETHHELRVPVFEQSINAGQDPGKVRFPGDLDRPEGVVRKLVEDRTLAPFLREWVDSAATAAEDDSAATAADSAAAAGDGETETDDEAFADTFWELGHKHGTYWRWLRPVVGGEHVDGANDERSLRIEYRPLPTQPSVREIVGLQCLVAGLIRGLVAADHPLERLDWEDARRSFYNAVADGPEARLHWVTADGERTTDSDRIFEEVFAYARRGLRDRGIADETIDRYLDPLEFRRERRLAPSEWKRRRVAEGVDDGLDLEAAIREMQAEYVERAGRPLSEWE